jgi:endo-1,4-beta-xylanase
MVTRRALLAGGAALAVAGRALAQTPATGLDALARAKGMRFGSTFAGKPWAGMERGSFDNPNYAALLERDCGLLVPENELKWQALRPSPDKFDFSRFDPMIAWSEAKGMKMRGHTLLWNKVERFPRWLVDHDFGAQPRQAAEKMLGEHIRTVCQRYGTGIYSYDVVNETIDEKTGGQRESSLSRAFGSADDMVDFAFHAAREAAPHAELVYNDYMDWEPGNDLHCAGVLRLLEGFRKRNVPVDALGLQSHIGIHSDGDVRAKASSQERAWRKFLDEAVAMGYRLVITEFDVTDNALPVDHQVRDRAVADYARAYLDICFSYPQLRDVLIWGMCDKYSWLQGFRPRADGERKRPCPYDAEFRAKPLYEALVGAFNAAPRR